ncbi:MAG: methylated-DNA--[protein]-cysteine S-methyltransferase [Anaerolineae bacterium]|nr:methylated-DNA--[protein]-cysteine S-methyltransferase [Anaerolineae bacterium]
MTNYTPTPTEVSQSRQQVLAWFARTAPLIRWTQTQSPVGTIYLAVNEHGLCSLDFGISLEDFLNRLDPLAQTEEHDLADYTAQLQEYFSGKRRTFDLPVDLSGMTAFQRSVLQTALNIPAGEVWTYGQVARMIGRPKASRAVGQALGSNPVPIIIPCHRVIASSGKLTGYSAGAGIASKKWLLQMEGAL